MEFWTYENWRAHGHRATVHRGDCGSCNHGSGIQGGGQTPNGRWLGPFNNAEDAQSALPPMGIEVRSCGRCMP